MINPERPIAVYDRYSPFQLAYILPLVQSVTTGILFLLPALVFCHALKWASDIAWAAAGIVAFGTWIDLRMKFTDLTERFMLQFETVEYEAPPEVPVTRVEITQKDSVGNFIQGIYNNWPVAPENIPEVARGLLRGYSFSVHAWAGEGRPFRNRPEFETWRNSLMSQGLAVWKNPNEHTAGWLLTRLGIDVMSKICGEAPPPPGNSRLK